jgi:exodeoxyribonuclease-3
MTYNILTGGNDSHGAGRLEHICQTIVGARPDVVVLQECNGFERNGYEAMHRVEAAIGMRGVLAIASTGFHVGLFVRQPACRLVQTYRLDAEVHHAVIAATLEFEGVPLTVVGAHLNPFGGLSRLAEVQHLIRFIRGERVFVVGDLNSLSSVDADRYDPSGWLPRRRARHVRLGEGGGLDTRAIAALEECQLIDCFRPDPPLRPWLPTNQTPLLDTWPSYQVRIDYIFADAASAARITHRERVDGGPADGASDHYPLLVDVDLSGD